MLEGTGTLRRHRHRVRRVERERQSYRGGGAHLDAWEGEVEELQVYLTRSPHQMARAVLHQIRRHLCHTYTTRTHDSHHQPRQQLRRQVNLPPAVFAYCWKSRLAHRQDPPRCTAGKACDSALVLIA